MHIAAADDTLFGIEAGEKEDQIRTGRGEQRPGDCYLRGQCLKEWATALPEFTGLAVPERLPPKGGMCSPVTAEPMGKGKRALTELADHCMQKL